MPITLRCKCGREASFRDDMAGQSGRCYGCGAEIAIPAPTAPAAATTAPCPACGGINRIDARDCKWCRKPMGAPAPAAAPSNPTSVGEAVRRVASLQRLTGIPWEDGDGNFLSMWWRTWWGAQFGGETFWNRMPWSGGFATPLKYALMLPAQAVTLVAVIGGPLMVLNLSLIRDRALQGVGLGVGCLLGVAYTVGAIAGTAAGTFLWAGVTHLASMILGGRGSFEATYRCNAYLTGTYAWFLIPFAGLILQPATHVLGLSAALARAHDMPRWKGAIAALAPALPVLLLGLLVLVALLAP